jgi:hypothetical protein
MLIELLFIKAPSFRFYRIFNHLFTNNLQNKPTRR